MKYVLECDASTVARALFPMVDLAASAPPASAGKFARMAPLRLAEAATAALLEQSSAALLVAWYCCFFCCS